MTIDKVIEELEVSLTMKVLMASLKGYGFAIISDRQVHEFGAPIAHVTVLASNPKYPALMVTYTFDEAEGDLIFDLKVRTGRLVPVTTYQFHETKEAN